MMTASVSSVPTIAYAVASALSRPGTERLHIGPGRPCRARARRRPAPARPDLPALIALVFAGAALLAVSLTCLGIGLLTA
jgi:hypothetical protein